MPKKCEATMQPEEIAIQLDAKLKELAPGAGWDAAGAWVDSRDSSSRVRLRYLGLQSTMSFQAVDVENYLHWLNEGNVGTIMKWGGQAKRRLK